MNGGFWTIYSWDIDQVARSKLEVLGQIFIGQHFLTSNFFA